MCFGGLFMKKVTFVLILLLAFAGYVSAQERYVKFVDEAKQDASFLAFRTRLIKEVENKNAKYIYGILDPQIKLTFGGHSGIADFKELWKPENKDSKFWVEFSKVITKGGEFSPSGNDRRGMFTAPYTYSSWPEDVDAFDHEVIFGNNVNLREGPSTESRSLGLLSYNIVKVDRNASQKFRTGPEEHDFDYSWYKIETLGGQKGFVRSDFVRSHIDYRAGFEKKRGQWKMVFFIAGD